MPAQLPGFRPSLPRRIAENFQRLWNLPGNVARLPLADDAFIHMLDASPNASLTSHAGSAAVHVLLFAAAFAILSCPTVAPIPKPIAEIAKLPKLLYRTPDVSPPGNTNTLGRNGNSGDHNPLPPTTGELPPTSRIVFASPRPIDNPNPKLPAATAIFSAEAPDFPLPVAGPGLPWAADRSNSGGPGEHGIGVGKEYGAGDTSGNGAGVGNDFGHYGAVVSYVSCKYCPDPQYSDEARKAKLQGHVTLRVLVGTDGRAKDVQIVQRLGMGLDENSLEAIRHWQFLPARDAAHRPVASWITIETVFRLF